MGWKFPRLGDPFYGPPKATQMVVKKPDPKHACAYTGKSCQVCKCSCCRTWREVARLIIYTVLLPVIAIMWVLGECFRARKEQESSYIDGPHYDHIIFPRRTRAIPTQPYIAVRDLASILSDLTPETRVVAAEPELIQGPPCPNCQGTGVKLELEKPYFVTRLERYGLRDLSITEAWALLDWYSRALNLSIEEIHEIARRQEDGDSRRSGNLRSALRCISHLERRGELRR